ncbi:helix-turn-helix domain-containing protein [Clostridium fallax]|uniref:AraC-type DNA-binding protein n=1 Tax=Clostridium fallax TaxID=1533 RepID=A0A1M4STF4_9CLOT|nr:AraC family transcriptional regulator [Clostridium fallax]SHE35471.1 AraC-type DNA-binding protein [Clostridium fallax]SQB07962.1 AraC family transcriptional regulator [Clostridium fallax]
MEIANKYLYEDKIKTKILSDRLEDVINEYKIFSSSFIQNNNNNLRVKKNHLIILLVSLSRTLCSQESNCICLKTICDEFIDKIENCNGIKEITHLGEEAIKSYYKFIINCSTRRENIIIKNAIRFIENNLFENLSLELISKNIHISKNYLSILFKQNTNYKISEFINIKRIDKAKELLICSDLPLSYISDVCGFKNQSYFSTVFRKVVKVSPFHYRHTYKKY